MNKDEVYTLIERHYRDNYKHHIRKYTRYTRNVSRAEDIVQEAYMRALDYWKSCPSAEQIPAWFNTILFNCMKDNRKEEKRHGMSETIEGLEDNLVAPAQTIPAVIYNQVVEKINQQSPDVAQVLELFLIKGMQQKEIMKVVPKTNQAIKDIIRHFRSTIRDQYRWTI